MFSVIYAAESSSRNADFILIARKGDTTTLSPKGCRPLSEANTTCRRKAAITLARGAGVNLPL